ncbi:CocE/NonD family hydrolase [Phytoactinopolyspora limicola]|uniref:CocE/NonD family hydrolase n=1 Tax=Phytoactinopolyspora limicola TaxID=2715536 RepID=UPI00140B9133|nr:CocE/NonD family hydrolase [Phytoactinopolyspora limicola]
MRMIRSSRSLVRLAVLAIAAALCGMLLPAIGHGTTQETYPRGYDEETFLTDRTGQKLKVHLTRPANADGEPVAGEFPVVLHYTYFPTATWEPATRDVMQSVWTLTGFNLAEGLEKLVHQGYVVAHVGLPGAGGSQGHFEFDKHEIGRAGYDVVEWLAHQPWSDGNIGMYGGSGNGIAQLMTAAERPPHLKTIIPAVAYQDLYRDTMYRGGMPALGEIPMIAALALGVWAWQGVDLPTNQDELEYLLDTMVKRITDAQAPPPFLLEWYANPTRSSYWDKYTYDVEKIDVPVWVWATWDDHFTLGSFRTFENVGTEQKMLAVGYHGHSMGPDFDPVAEAGRWYDYWLKGDRSNGIGEQLRDEPVRYYVQEANVWRSATDWPLPETEGRELYASTGSTVPGARGRLDTQPPASGGTNSYLYTPLSSRLGAQNGFLNQGIGGLLPRLPNTDDNTTLTAYNHPTGKIDQRLNAADSATFVGPVLTEDVEVTGEPQATIFASTSSTDTDWVVRIIDVFPDDSTIPQPGYWNLVTTGWLKGTHRDGHHSPVAIPRDEVVEYQIPLFPTSYTFKKGHRIGIQIASADPRNVPNPNLAVNTIHHGEETPTTITLPVRR